MLFSDTKCCLNTSDSSEIIEVYQKTGEIKDIKMIRASIYFDVLCTFFGTLNRKYSNLIIIALFHTRAVPKYKIVYTISQQINII